LLSLRVEKRLSKEELLEAYLNNVYWGHGED
jgi:membrane peptidoglycan carboxypeptidase